MKTSDNETVAEIVKELRDDANAVADDSHDEDVWTNLEMMEIYHSLAARIEAANKREVKELRDCLEKAASMLCHECFHYDQGRCDSPGSNCMARKWRNALKGETK